METKCQQRPLIGIIGGMGPLASTAFVSTIYDLTTGRLEQHAGRLILYSDPAIPDRTEAFLNRRDSTVYEPFVNILSLLRLMHVERIVVCCVTLHHLFPTLPSELRESIVSLVDTIFSALQDSHGNKHLLLCTSGTLQLGIFQRHPLWKMYKDTILVPDAADQHRIHSLIYQLKARQSVKTASSMLEALLATYHVDSFIAGCTEIHLLSRYLMLSRCQPQKCNCIDPLLIIAQKIAEERL